MAPGEEDAEKEAARVAELAQKNEEMLKEKHPEHRDFRLDRLTVDQEEAERREKERKEAERKARELPPPRERIDFGDWEFPTEDLMVFEGEQTVSVAPTAVHEEDADVIVGTIDLATFDITDETIKEKGGDSI